MIDDEGPNKTTASGYINLSFLINITLGSNNINIVFFIKASGFMKKSCFITFRNIFLLSGNGCLRDGTEEPDTL